MPVEPILFWAWIQAPSTAMGLRLAACLGVFPVLYRALGDPGDGWFGGRLGVGGAHAPGQQARAGPGGERLDGVGQPLDEELGLRRLAQDAAGEEGRDADAAEFQPVADEVADQQIAEQRRISAGCASRTRSSGGTASWLSAAKSSTRLSVPGLE